MDAPRLFATRNFPAGRWSAMLAAMERLAGVRSFDAIVEIVRTAARGISGADGITFVRREGDRCHYIAEDAVSPLWTGQDFPLTACISGWAMLNDEIAIIPDIYADPRIPHDAYRTTFVRSLVMIPVGAGTPGAAIGAYWSEAGAASDEIIDLLAALARAVAIAIENVALNATLEARVEQALAERRTIEDVLRQAQKMEAIGQLTGGIAHDFNNLLTIITGNLDLIGLRLGDSVDPRLARALENAHHGADRAAMLIRRLLAFSRCQPLTPRPTDVEKLVAGLSDLLARALGETISVQTVSEPGLWRVAVDPNLLESGIVNLAVNARDAMNGSGSLRIELRNLEVGPDNEVDHPGVVHGGFVLIAVSDTGCGMAPEVIKRACEPFFTTKDVGRGTGLGLSQVYGFVKQSGGHFRILSAPGQGATIRLYLPRLDAAEVPEDFPRARRVTSSRSGETILVVEDEEGVRNFAAEALAALGYKVLEAQDAAAALAILEDRDTGIDLLFTDVVMPGMTGPALAEVASVMRPGLRTLFASGYTRDAFAGNAALDEGPALLAKPFTAAALADAVRETLDRA